MTVFRVNFEQKISQRSDRDLMGDVSFFFVARIGMPRFDLGEGVCLEPVDQIVGLDAEAFAAAHLDKRPFAVFVGKLETKFFRRRGRKRDHFVREMNAGLFAALRRDRGDAFSDDFLRIRLPRVDDVVDRLAAAKRRNSQLASCSASVVVIQTSWPSAILVKLPVIEIEP